MSDGRGTQVRGGGAWLLVAFSAHHSVLPYAHVQVLRRAAALVGARHDGARDVVAGVWGRVDVPTFVEACRQVRAEGGGQERAGKHFYGVGRCRRPHWAGGTQESQGVYEHPPNVCRGALQAAGMLRTVCLPSATWA